MKPDYLADNEFDPDFERLAPGLSKLKKENPFRVPDQYFDSLSGNIQQKINALPDLERMNRENPFAVPEGYFESLPSGIQQRIIDEKKTGSVFGEWISTVFRPKYALAFGVVIILLVFGIKYFSKQQQADTTDSYLSCDEIRGSSYMDDLDETILVEALEQEQNGAADTKEDNSIEQYLMDNNIDVSQLENHL